MSWRKRSGSTSVSSILQRELALRRLHRRDLALGEVASEPVERGGPAERRRRPW